MTSKEVWIVFTKSKALEGCSIDVGGCDFYYSEAYVPVGFDEQEVTSLETVINRAKEVLLEKRLVLSDVSKCLRYHKEDWDVDTVMNKEVHSVAAKALFTSKVEFGTFRSEEIEERVQCQHNLKELDVSFPQY